MLDRIDENDKQAILAIKSKIKNKNIDIFDFLGIVNVLLYSKTIFKRNKEVDEFILEIFDIKLPEYVVKSRTLMVARISRIVFDFEKGQIEDKKNKIINSSLFSDEDLDIMTASDKQAHEKPNKKKNENEKLETWLKGL